METVVTRWWCVLMRKKVRRDGARWEVLRQGWLAVLSLEASEGRHCWKGQLGLKRFIVLPFNSFGNWVEIDVFLCLLKNCGII